MRSVSLVCTNADPPVLKPSRMRSPVAGLCLPLPAGVFGSEPIMIGSRHIHAPGKIIGTAVEPFRKGTGPILVLLSSHSQEHTHDILQMRKDFQGHSLR